jgi:hypothetical protein
MREQLKTTLLADYRRTGGWAGIIHGTMLLAVPVIEIALGKSVDLQDVASAARVPWLFALIYFIPVIQGMSIIGLAWAFEQGMRARIPRGLRRGIFYAGLAGGAVYALYGFISVVAWPILGARYQGSHAAGIAGASAYQNVASIILDVALTGYGLWAMFGTWYAQVAGMFGRGTNYTGFFYGFAAMFSPYAPILTVAQWLLGIPWAFATGIGFLRERQKATAPGTETLEITAEHR